jgi:hypothetical protein
MTSYNLSHLSLPATEQSNFDVVTWLLTFCGSGGTMFLLFASMMKCGPGLILPGDLLWMIPYSIPGKGSSLILLLQACHFYWF